MAIFDLNIGLMQANSSQFGMLLKFYHNSSVFVEIFKKLFEILQVFFAFNLCVLKFHGLVEENKNSKRQTFMTRSVV